MLRLEEKKEKEDDEGEEKGNGGCCDGRFGGNPGSSDDDDAEEGGTMIQDEKTRRKRKTTAKSAMFMTTVRKDAKKARFNQWCRRTGRWQERYALWRECSEFETEREWEELVDASLPPPTPIPAPILSPSTPCVYPSTEPAAVVVEEEPPVGRVGDPRDALFAIWSVPVSYAAIDVNEWC